MADVRQLAASEGSDTWLGPRTGSTRGPAPAPTPRRSRTDGSFKWCYAGPSLGPCPASGDLAGLALEVVATGFRHGRGSRSRRHAANRRFRCCPRAHAAPGQRRPSPSIRPRGLVVLASAWPRGPGWLTGTRCRTADRTNYPMKLWSPLPATVRCAEPPEQPPLRRQGWSGRTGPSCFRPEGHRDDPPEARSRVLCDRALVKGLGALVGGGARAGGDGCSPGPQPERSGPG